MELKRSIYKDLLDWKNKNTGKVLSLEGARQVGKTFALKKFANEHFKQIIYINMAEPSGKILLDCLEQAEHRKIGQRPDEEILHKAMLLYDAAFSDSLDTVIIIDEIQESSKVFNTIRSFSRNFSCYVIVTGSYLGKLLDPAFFLPAGDCDYMTMTTLTFEEFLDAYGKLELFNSLDPYGSSPHSEYDEIKKYFDIYLKIGGYPEIVTTYLETCDFSECEKKLWALVRVFMDESKRYFDSVTDVNIFDRIFQSIVTLMLTEKHGFPDIVNELSKLAYSDTSGTLTKSQVNHAISWLCSSHIIGYADKCIDCNPKEVKTNNRIYFLDLGIAQIYLKQAFATEAETKGLLAETFVYHIMQKHIRINIAGNAPWFATWKNNGELDFYALSHLDRCAYGIEVKSTNSTAKTAQALFKAGKLDYLYYLKGETYGGITEDRKTITIPLYLASKISFNLGMQ